MSRQGKDFEELIKTIETALAKGDVEIKSPDYIPDKITGRKREVDISIRTKVGSSPILVILECRDRVGQEDTTWIEQLATKKNDVGASLAIAITSSNFSKNALEKAKHYGIETRTYGKIDVNEIKGWLKFIEIPFITCSFVIDGLTIEFTDGTSLVPNSEELNLSNEKTRIIIRLADNHKFTFRETVHSVLGRTNIYDDVPTDGQFKKRSIAITAPENEAGKWLRVIDNSEIKEIARFVFTLSLKRELEMKSISRIGAYKSDDETLLENVEFDMDLLGQEGTISIKKNKQTGALILSIQEKKLPIIKAQKQAGDK